MQTVKIMIVAALLAMPIGCYAQKYVIIKISDKTPLMYQKKSVFVGDTIQDKYSLQLKKGQVVVLKDVQTQLPLCPIKGDKYLARNCKSLREYFFPTRHGATRGMESVRLKETIGEEILWVDSMLVPTMYIPDRFAQRYFVMEIEGEPKGVVHVLPGVRNNTSILFSHEQIFGTDEPHEIYFNLRVGNGYLNEYLEKSELVLEHVKLTPIKEDDYE